MTNSQGPEGPYAKALVADRRGDAVLSRDLLREAVAAGDDRARLPLAGTLIDGRGGPVEPEEAIQALEPLEAADPIARRMICAALVIGPGGWPAAARRRAAHGQAGERDAMLELGLLAADAGHDAAQNFLMLSAAQGSGHALAALARQAASDGAAWLGLSQQIDALARAGHPLAGPLKTLLRDLPETAAPPRAEAPDWDAAADIVGNGPRAGSAAPLSEFPAIAAHSGTLSSVLCDYLLAATWPMLQRAKIFDGASGRTREDPHRRAHAASIPQSLMDLPILSIQSRMAAAAGMPLDRAEALAVLVYQPGDEYRAHFDFFSQDDGWASAEIAARGQRAATALAALNTQYEGGETVFPRADVSWRGAIGDVLTFRSLLDDGSTDPKTLHAGAPVTSGWKALASLWLRERAVGPQGIAVRQ
jgi:prolyl 4-hydroxylase